MEKGQHHTVESKIKLMIAKTKHGGCVGGTETPLYRVWVSIRNKCTNKQNRAYKYYGARGIKVCSEWFDFVPFKHWALANGYQEGLTIDRIDNNGNYEPSNCQFIPNEQNCIKRRYNSRVVRQFNDGQLIATYPSTKEAGRQTSIDSSSISAVCNGKRKMAGGFTWK